MVLQVIGYILLFMLMLSIVNVVKELILFLVALGRNTSMNITTVRGWILGISIAYILTYIFA